MKIFNLNADEWDRTEEREGWRFKDAWVGAHTDAELIGASMYEVEPGNKQGAISHPPRERGMGDRPPRRADAAHARGRAAAAPGRRRRVPTRQGGRAPDPQRHGRARPRPMLSTLIAPDIVEYLDTGKIGARSVA